MTYYEILQVTENASDEVIRMAYKALAKKYHPDLFVGDPKLAEEKMKEINTAYAVLTNPIKRAEYDALLRRNAHGIKSSDPNQYDAPHNSKPHPRFSDSKKRGWIISILLLMVFLLSLHPYTESDLYDYALLFGSISFCWTSLLFVIVPIIVSAFKNLTTKEIKILCATNSTAIYVLFLVLYIFEITPTMLLGWLIAIIYYFVNKHVLLLIDLKGWKRKSVLSILVGVLAVSVILTTIATSVETSASNESESSEKDNPSKKDTAEWISEREFFYYEDENAYVLVFQLSNEAEEPIECTGTVELKIVNFENIVLYEQKYDFDKSDFYTWTFEGGAEKLLATIFIYPWEIDGGSSSEGTIYFTVYGEDFYFDECTLNIFDLPTKPDYSVRIRTITLNDMETASMILDLWEAGEATEEAMITLMDKYGSTQGGGKLHFVEPGYYVTEVDSWCFDSARKPGDVAIIKNDYGYTICYFSSAVE